MSIFQRGKIHLFATLRNNDGGTGGNNGGEGGDKGGSGGGGGGAPMVSKAELDKVINELHGYKQAAKDADLARKKSEEDNLRANNEWKTLAEKKDTDLKALQEKYSSLNQTIIKDKKITAIREEALKKGIRQEALQDIEMLDLKEVVVETTSTGRIMVSGAASAVENIKTLRPHWFGGSAGPGVNTNSPGVNAPEGEITVEQIKAAEKKKKETGDPTEYNRLSAAYFKQRSTKRPA